MDVPRDANGPDAARAPQPVNGQGDPARPGTRRSFGIWFWCGFVVALLAWWVYDLHGSHFTLWQVQSQDLLVLIVMAVVLMLLDRFAPRLSLPGGPRTWPARLVIAVAFALALWAGTYLIMLNFPVSRDEVMVPFDMIVFAHGHLAEPLTPAWRPFAASLVPAFLLNSHMPTGLVSAYLPVNALTRLMFSQVADPALMNPALFALGGLALHASARRLFGTDDRAVMVTMLLYLTSAGTLVNAMTAYAMNPHTVFNLVWLALFLRDDRRGHAGAILVGFLAIGLHQIVFHPLFAVSFLLWRAGQGRWRLVAVYGVAYALAVGFWVIYPTWAGHAAGIPPTAVGSQADFWHGRVLPLLLNHDPATVTIMTLNLLRMIAWQNWAMLPLICAALPLARRNVALTAPLLGGVILTILFVGFVLPYQGLGWSYRYLQPAMADLVLLGGYGYRRLAQDSRPAVDGRVAVLTLATVLFALPWLSWQAHRFVAQYAAVDRMIGSRHGDMVLVDTEVGDRPGSPLRFAASVVDDVRNRPDLTNRPIRLSSRELSLHDVATLCGRGTISVVTRRDERDAGFNPTVLVPSPRFDAMVASIAHRPCFIGPR